ncbi:hypothetical protein QDR37_03455 [Amnibacterium sp. CER49]|uniref:hypothetical protein n=1 Tax=Amnibacterium sp. CER49 TaxID=3039161 RepID=UPI002448485E|nr:hypothetical protein [Amnibacterium sp. CER49]MDH2442996.1 hypothetical protein [Amnibacterium sp. CER49]
MSIAGILHQFVAAHETKAQQPKVMTRREARAARRAAEECTCLACQLDRFA